MKIIWVDGNLTAKPENPKDLGLLHAIDGALKNFFDREEHMKITGVWTNIPKDAIRVAR